MDDERRGGKDVCQVVKPLITSKLNVQRCKRQERRGDSRNPESQIIRPIKVGDSMSTA
jgi:hypothetical protein